MAVCNLLLTRLLIVKTMRRSVVSGIFFIVFAALFQGQPVAASGPDVSNCSIKAVRYEVISHPYEDNIPCREICPPFKNSEPNRDFCRLNCKDYHRCIVEQVFDQCKSLLLMANATCAALCMNSSEPANERTDYHRCQAACPAAWSCLNEHGFWPQQESWRHASTPIETGVVGSNASGHGVTVGDHDATTVGSVSNNTEISGGSTSHHGSVAVVTAVVIIAFVLVAAIIVTALVRRSSLCSYIKNRLNTRGSQMAVNYVHAPLQPDDGSTLQPTAAAVSSQVSTIRDADDDHRECDSFLRTADRRHGSELSLRSATSDKETPVKTCDNNVTGNLTDNGNPVKQAEQETADKPSITVPYTFVDCGLQER